MDVRYALIAALGLSLSACASYDGDNYRRSPGYSTYGSGAVGCYDCGVVTGISSYTGERRTTGAGAVAGAVVGGVLGNQVGSGDGKKAATVAGAVVGGIVGNNIEKNRDSTWYEVSVRMTDGRQVVVTQNDLNGVREGSRVVLRDGKAYLD
jgi:outer membrane lipoprotein SlyB